MLNTQSNRCQSVKHITEPQTQCYLSAKKNEKYCAMHLLQKTIRDFVEIDYLTEVENNTNRDNKVIVNEILYSININDTSNTSDLKSVTPKTKKSEKKGYKYTKVKPLPVKNNTKVITHEEKISTVTSAYQDSQDDLDVKLLILVNEDIESKLPELIGPVYKDTTLSEDDQDPITFDTIWTLNNGVKIPSNFNKYYLFSYVDVNNKIRCLTVFTIYNMINDNNFMHPITMDLIPEKDLERAKILINLYDTKLNLFNTSQEHLSPEFILKNKVCSLFNKLHINDIYLEEKWFTEIASIDKLLNIIKKTKDLFNNNRKAIFLSNKTDNDSFAKIKTISTMSVFSNYIFNKSADNTENILSMKVYIVEEWEKMFGVYDLTANSLVIWIMVCGLSYALPEITDKYPQILEFDKN